MRTSAIGIPAGFCIVPAREDHLAAILSIEAAAEALFSPADLPPGYAGDGLDEAGYRQAIAEERVLVALATGGGGRSERAVGFAACRVLGGNAHLEEIDVHPEFGRRGLGAALLLQVDLWALRRGLRRITLTTFCHLPWNAPFYARHGYRELAPAELTAELAAILRAEAQHGLDPAKRVAMIKDL